MKSTSITPRENILRVLRHERPQWIPVTAHVDPYNQPSHEGMSPALQAKFKKVEWGGDSIVTFSRALGLDIADFVWPPPVRCQRKNVTLEERTDGADHITIWHTPAGELRQVIRQQREDGTTFQVEHLVKSPADFPALAAIFADETWELDPKMTHNLSERRQLIGDDGLLMVSLPGTPLGMLFRQYCTVENLAYLWADAEPELHELFAIMERNYLTQYQLLAGLESVDVLIGMDDTSTTVLSPAMFGACNLELTNRRADLAHAAGKFYFHHSCGLIKDLLPLYRQTRMDAVHAFSPPPLGNVTIAEGRPLLGDRITIYTPPYVMADPNWDVAAARAAVQQEFAQAGNGDHLIICLCAYPHRTMEQSKFVADCCREFGSLQAH